MSAATNSKLDHEPDSTLEGGETLPIRILLIEDQFEIARLFMRRLQWSPRAAFSVQHAGNLTDGLRDMARRPPDLILLDLLLPETEGLETIRPVVQQANGIPVVVLSATDDESLAQASLREGVQDFLVKQEQDARSLARAVVHTLERSRRWLTSPLRTEPPEPLGA